MQGRGVLHVARKALQTPSSILPIRNQGGLCSLTFQPVNSHVPSCLVRVSEDCKRNLRPCFLAGTRESGGSILQLDDAGDLPGGIRLTGEHEHGLKATMNWRTRAVEWSPRALHFIDLNRPLVMNHDFRR